MFSSTFNELVNLQPYSFRQRREHHNKGILVPHSQPTDNTDRWQRLSPPPQITTTNLRSSSSSSRHGIREQFSLGEERVECGAILDGAMHPVALVSFAGWFLWLQSTLNANALRVGVAAVAVGDGANVVVDDDEQRHSQHPYCY